MKKEVKDQSLLRSLLIEVQIINVGSRLIQYQGLHSAATLPVLTDKQGTILFLTASSHQRS